MIELTEDMRILVAVKPAHFRCGIDGLSRGCAVRCSMKIHVPASFSSFVTAASRR
jgi:hypothetical protein